MSDTIQPLALIDKCIGSKMWIVMKVSGAEREITIGLNKCDGGNVVGGGGVHFWYRNAIIWHREKLKGLIQNNGASSTKYSN